MTHPTVALLVLWARYATAYAKRQWNACHQVLDEIEKLTRGIPR